MILYAATQGDLIYGIGWSEVDAKRDASRQGAWGDFTYRVVTIDQAKKIAAGAKTWGEL